MKKQTLALITVLGLGLYGCSSSNKDEIPTQSPYIAKVFEYKPAVGQFINVIPRFEKGDTDSDIIRKANEAIAGENAKGMISLGGFGGSVTFGFDHMVENKPGLRDFRVLGNAIETQLNPKPGTRGGSSEPAIIMVSYDANNNGKPDDAWYEIVGSEHNQSIADYQITYYKPDPLKDPVKEEGTPHVVDAEYIRWEDNQGGTGYKIKNSFNGQSYFPEWITEDKITFTGRLLPNNAVDESGNGTLWMLYSFGHGYADNVPNSHKDSAIDIDWAVDANGKSANLPGIHFVKVYTAINQEAGWTGEVSAEITGAYDLHLKNEIIESKL